MRLGFELQAGMRQMSHGAAGSSYPSQMCTCRRSREGRRGWRRREAADEGACRVGPCAHEDASVREPVAGAPRVESRADLGSDVAVPARHGPDAARRRSAPEDHHLVEEHAAVRVACQLNRHELPLSAAAHGDAWPPAVRGLGALARSARHTLVAVGVTGPHLVLRRAEEKGAPRALKRAEHCVCGCSVAVWLARGAVRCPGCAGPSRVGTCCPTAGRGRG